MFLCDVFKDASRNSYLLEIYSEKQVAVIGCGEKKGAWPDFKGLCVLMPSGLQMAPYPQNKRGNDTKLKFYAKLYQVV